MNLQICVGIIGAGPAGLLLALQLLKAGIETLILENRSRAEIESAVRAGVLEQGTVDLMTDLGIDARMRREGYLDRAVELRFDGYGHRIDLYELTNGSALMVYPQQEVIKDAVAAYLERGGTILFNVKNVTLSDLGTAKPVIHFEHEERQVKLRCDFVAGCDGSHGISQSSIPVEKRKRFSRSYPFAWLGTLITCPRSIRDLTYAYHERGFTLVSTRTPELQRMYIQCDPRDNIANWSDEQILQEIQLRLASKDGWQVVVGPIIQKSILPMRSLVTEPMQYGRLYLAGDAAHIVPPTGAKGLNLAVADIRHLAKALIVFYKEKRDNLLEAYSADCLKRIWRTEYFSWWMTSLLHRHPGDDPFQQHLQRAELERIISSRKAATSFAELYAGSA